MSLMLAACLSVLLVGLNVRADGPPQIGSWPVSGDLQGREAQDEDAVKRGGGGGGEMLEALLDREADRCFGRKCGHSEECCRGAACVHIEGVSGTCLPVHDKESYQGCDRDSDCGGAGLSCSESGHGGGRTCQLDAGSIRKRGAFNEACESSAECDTGRGLCCQILRRHRMAFRKVCHYFLDPASCIGDIPRDDAREEFKFNDAQPFFKARLG